MSRDMTPEEVKKEYINNMGEELGKRIFELRNEVIWLKWKLAEFKELFDKKSSRIDLMNRAAPEFFFMIQKIMFKEIMLHIARLTDKKRIAGHECLTIQLLPDIVDKKLKGTIEGLNDSAIKKADFCREWRNKSIAHIDLNLALNRGAYKLKPANIARINEAIECIAAVLKAVYEHYQQGYILEPPPITEGASSLLCRIWEGVNENYKREKRKQENKLNRDDLKFLEILRNI